MVSEAQSIANISVAAAISAAMLGVGLRGGRGDRRRRAAWTAAGLLGGALTSFVGYLESETVQRLATHQLATVWAGILVGMLGGIALLALGLRGRRVGDHEHCRRCGFDLFNRPPDTRVCGECGTPLDPPRAIVVGERRRRAVPMVAGAFLLFVALALGTAIGRAMAQNQGAPTLIGYKPLGWLVDNILAPEAGGATRWAHHAELMRRLADGELSDAGARRAIAAARGHADRFRGGQLADVVAVEAWSRGLLDEGTIRPIVRRQAVAYFTLAAESAPDRVPFRLMVVRPLSGAGGAANVRWSYAVADRVDTINGERLPPGAVATLARSSRPWLPSGLLGDLYRLPAPLPAGPATAAVQMTVTVTLAAAGRPTIVEAVPVAVSGQTTIVPGLARRLRDDGNRPRQFDGMANATIAPGRGGGRVTIDVSFPSTGMWPTFVGDAFAVAADGREHALGEVFIESAGSFEVDASSLPARPFALVFRPRPERGVDHLEDVQSYQHEIKIDPERVGR